MGNKPWVITAGCLFSMFTSVDKMSEGFMFSDTVDPPHVGRNPNPNPSWIDCVDMVPHLVRCTYVLPRLGQMGLEPGVLGSSALRPSWLSHCRPLLPAARTLHQAPLDQPSPWNLLPSICLKELALMHRQGNTSANTLVCPSVTKVKYNDA